ncbi:MAG: serine/threonine protein phosphatase [Acidobacteria bacterium]|nr:serine/threonine protein phosphatase [Acidobacteriota bacterium]
MSTYVIGDVHGRYSQLTALLREVPCDLSKDKLVFLGDLIDRGAQIKEVVSEVLRLRNEHPNVVTLRGNHEQMLLDCVDFGDLSWLIPENGGQDTIAQYGCPLHEIDELEDIVIPDDHLEFFREMPLYHEDDLAIYVHAGLVEETPLEDVDEDVLLWSRDFSFYMHYAGKLCFFGHTPTRYLPRDGRRHEYDIFMASNCVGMDTGSEPDCPLSCLRVDDFTLWQTFADGETTVHDHGPLLAAYHERRPVAEGASLGTS